MSDAPTVVRGACHHDCPDTCAWEVTVRDGVAVQLRGDPTHPFTDGQLCPKVNPFLDRVYHPDRLLRPLRRTGPKGEGRFEPIGWDAAIAEIAERIGTAVSQRGGETVLPYSLDGTQGLVQKGVLADRFFAALGATQLNRHICGVTAWHGAADVLGMPLGADPTEIASARTIVLWGTNTLLTNRHLWPYVEEAHRNGASVIVVDPVSTMTARRSDWHVQPRPGTDVALVLGIIGVLDRDTANTARTFTVPWPPSPSCRARDTCAPRRCISTRHLTIWSRRRVRSGQSTCQPSARRSLMTACNRRSPCS